MKSFKLPILSTALLTALIFSSPALAQDDAQTSDEPDEERTVNGRKPDPVEDAAEEDETFGEFQFGSYGRVRFDLDDTGNRGASNNIVAFGPRLFEEDYAEFDLSYTLRKADGFTTRVLFTFAIFEPFAHYSGDFGDQPLAVRNLYAEMRGISETLEGLSFWAGSRMYRGDDAYLLDWWPLDELNTVGGGVAYRRDGFDGRLHMGVNRLEDDYQLQVIQVPAQPLGARPKVVLDRQRLLSSGRFEYAAPDLLGDFGAKGVLYGEYHHIPEGERIPPELIVGGAPTQPEDEVLETLPEENGFVLGAELGLFESGTTNHLNLFFRYAEGLAAYGEFGVPFGVSQAGTADDAYELRGVLSGNWENRYFGVLAAAYLRKFEDADQNEVDLNDFVEGAAVLRPAIFITDHFQQAFEVSYQRFHPFGLDPETGQQPEPEVFQLSAMEILSFGRGNYTRPQLRLSYTVAFSNDDARAFFPAGDARRPDEVEHVVSLGAEWWFNSSTY